jgi:hypothetical protein
MRRMMIAIALILAPPIAYADDGGDQFRALVCIIDRNDGRPCSEGDAEALAGVEAREAVWAKEEAKHKAALEQLEGHKAALEQLESLKAALEKLEELQQLDPDRVPF